MASRKWDLTTWRKKHKRKEEKESDAAMLTDILEKMNNLAEAKISMPPDVLRQLGTAIKFCERVSTYYRSVPSSSTSNCS